jgi:FAD/FMN-containing dehydrogenase
MDRREFVCGMAALPLLAVRSPAVAVPKRGGWNRVRPGGRGWPAPGDWNALKRDVGGRLVKLRSPLDACRADVRAAGCDDLFRELENPFFLRDEPALTQSSGWADAWTTAPSAYAVAAETAADVAAAVDFARRYHLRLVVKGGGHSYQGRSCSVDSLLVWTRRLDDIELHDAFVPRGCEGRVAAQPAVSLGAGCIWLEAYDAVTTRGARYVQGGGCTTVGVAGLVQSGGFGSFSKRFGTVAAGLLEAEVVTADGRVRTVNACADPELFWALKGGGGGTFGVVTRITLRTRELPETFGGAFGTVQATSDAAFRDLIGQALAFYRDTLMNPHWGEQLRLHTDRTLEISMVFQGLSQEEAERTWRPFTEWLATRTDDFTIRRPVGMIALPARHMWDATFLRRTAPDLITGDDRPGAPESHFVWAGDRGQASQFLHGFHSAWLSAGLLEPGRRNDLADALHAASRLWDVSLQFNKGLAGAPPAELEAAADTATNPAAVDAFALAIIAGEGAPSFPGIPGHEPDLSAARRRAATMRRAMDELLRVVPQPGSYWSESDFFDDGWQRSFWGRNYARLASVKRTYDPEGLFFVHHGVGSEEWSADGFTRKS